MTRLSPTELAALMAEHWAAVEQQAADRRSNAASLRRFATRHVGTQESADAAGDAYALDDDARRMERVLPQMPNAE